MEFAAGAVTVCTGAVVLLCYREPEERRVSAAAPAGGLGDIVRRKDIWAVTFSAAVLAGCQWCYLSYIELYLTEDILFSLVTVTPFVLSVAKRSRRTRLPVAPKSGKIPVRFREKSVRIPTGSAPCSSH